MQTQLRCSTSIWKFQILHTHTLCGWWCQGGPSVSVVLFVQISRGWSDVTGWNLFTSLLKKISTSDVTSSPVLVKQETGNAKLNNTGGTFLLAIYTLGGVAEGLEHSTPSIWVMSLNPGLKLGDQTLGREKGAEFATMHKDIIQNTFHVTLNFLKWMVHQFRFLLLLIVFIGKEISFCSVVVIATCEKQRVINEK